MSLLDELENDEINEKESNDIYQRVSLDKIIPNERNEYEIKNIEPLASNILKHGQQDNGLAYIVEEESETKYKLIGGERRYRAIKLLNDLGFKDPNGDDWTYLLKVIPKPNSEEEEDLLILSNNLQREKTKKERNKEIKLLSALYSVIKAQDKEFDRECYGEEFNVQDREKKREYIARILHISERTVQDILSENRKAEELMEEGSTIVAAQEQIEEDKSNPYHLTSNDIDWLKMVSSNYSETLETKVTINKKLKMTIHFESLDDIAKYLIGSGCDSEGNGI